MAGTTNDMSILIGGDAGQGVESSGAGLCQAFARELTEEVCDWFRAA